MQQNDLIRTVQLRKLLAVVEELERLGVYLPPTALPRQYRARSKYKDLS